MRKPREKEINLVDGVPANQNDPVFLPIAHYLVEGVPTFRSESRQAERSILGHDPRKVTT